MNPGNRALWDYHGRMDQQYVGPPALERNCCFKYFIPSNGWEIITDTLCFIPEKIYFLNMSVEITILKKPWTKSSTCYNIQMSSIQSTSCIRMQLYHHSSKWQHTSRIIHKYSPSITNYHLKKDDQDPQTFIPVKNGTIITIENFCQELWELISR